MDKKQKTIIFDGKKESLRILLELKDKIAKNAKKPGLAAIIVGDDKPSHIYVKNKEKASHLCEVQFHKYIMGKNISEQELLDCIFFLNNDPTIDGIILQLPIPKKFDVDKIIASIDPKKDVDGFHPETLKKIVANKPAVHSALILAVEEILKQTGIDFRDKKVVLVSKCDIFYKTFQKEIEQLIPNLEIISPKDGNLKEKTAEADVLITAIGKANSIKKDMVKKGVIVIDIGTSWVGKKFVGDVDYDEVSKIASFITPVPGGVGPLTVAMIIKNVCQLAK